MINCTEIKCYAFSYNVGEALIHLWDSDAEVIYEGGTVRAQTVDKVNGGVQYTEFAEILVNIRPELYVSTEGKNLEAGFNPKYFLDSLKVIDDEEVYIEFGSSISPCLIKSVENNDYVYMILPIRLKED